MTRQAALALRIIESESERWKLASKRTSSLWRVTSPAALVCALAENPCRAVYKRGRLVHEAEI